MSHIHEKIDFVVSAWIVYKDKVLLILHKEQNAWLPIGGHIELDEDPVAALFREIREECGLDVEIISKKSPVIEGSSTKFLLRPEYIDIHPINDKHYHVALEYFARAKSDSVKLAESEHHEIHWFTADELDKPQFKILPVIKFLAKEVIKRVK